MDYRNLTSPCGIDCFNCEIYKDNITDEMRKRIKPYYPNKDISNIYCEGCKISGCLLMPHECETKECIAKKGLEFCCDCEDFPCNFLHPCSDQADKLPQNVKLYNLCRIKTMGFDTWVKETKNIRNKYYKGKMKLGSGPQIEDL